jgi:methionine-rich copper-binding protein CopC/uncharacterized protein YhjY with autotransporter beta-barrel domain/sugar lactone lactonase YvrE
VDKKNKYLIYSLIFLFFNSIFINSLNANPVLQGTPYNAAGKFTYPYGLTFNDDGSKMYIVGMRSNKDLMAEYSLTTPYDVSTSSFVREVHEDDPFAAIRFRPQDIRFNPSGSRMFISMFPGSEAINGVKTFSLSTSFDISTASLLHTLYPTDSGRYDGLEFNASGTKIFFADEDEIDEYTVSTAFDLSSTVTYVRSLDISNKTINSKSLAFSDDGTTLFVLSRDPRVIYEYVLTTGFDLSSATLVDEHNINSQEVQPQGIAFNDDGTKVFVIGTGGDDVNEYTLPAAYNLGLPTLSSSVPSDNATSIALDANIVLNFSEKIDVESGNIEIYKTSDNTNPVETIDVTSSQVTGTGTTTITINPSSDLEENTEYYVLIDATAFDDGSDASYAGITSTTALSFTAANSAPTLVSSVPADDATDVAIDANIVLNFSESVNADDGDIVIYKTSGGTEVETIASTASNVTGSGTSQITINPSADFEYGVEYYVLIDSGAFDDDNDEDYTGITSTTALSFTVNNRVDPTTIKDVVGSIDAQSELAKNYIRQSIYTVSNRLRYLRQNRGNDNLSKQNIKLDFGDTILTSLTNELLAKNDKSIIPDNWSSWSEGSISVSKIGDSLGSSSRETDGQALAIGFDTKLNNNDLLGFAIQYGKSDTDVGSSGSTTDSENINVSVYRTRPLNDDNFIEGMFGVGLIESDLVRVSGANTLTGSRNGTQVFGSINYGKTLDKGDFNLTPIARVDLGYTELDAYSETGTDALSYAKQTIESGLASIGLEFSDIIKFNDNKLKPFGSIEYGMDFSNSSEAKMNYVSDTSTIYTYTQGANSNHLITSVVGFEYFTKDNLEIISSYKRIQGNESEQTDIFNVFINFKSQRETEYAMSIDRSEDLKAGFEISKNINGFDLKFNANQAFNETYDQAAEVSLSRSF